MSIIDMPLDELKQYTGKSPLPDDFDEYWKKTIDEMNNTDPDIEITKAGLKSQNVDFYDLYFTGIGGASVYAKLLKPKKMTSPCPAIVEFHGYTGCSGDWVTKLGYAANGFVVTSLDCRGQGGKSEDKGSVRGNTHHGHIIEALRIALTDCFIGRYFQILPSWPGLLWQWTALTRHVSRRWETVREGDWL